MVAFASGLRGRRSRPNGAVRSSLPRANEAGMVGHGGHEWTAAGPDLDRPPPYDYASPLDVAAIADREPLLAALVTTRAFRRLRHIRFLGGIDYCLVPRPNGRGSNRRFTRYQHSLGVARLALLYAQHRDLPPAERRLACAAALLHDIGHAPLSHTLEPVFEEAFRLNHHRATEDIVLGRVGLGREVRSILRRFRVDADRLLAVLKGAEDPFEGFFSGPINLDTIEGILRSHQYMTHRTVCPDPVVVLFAAMDRASERDRNTIDSFWACKNDVYNLLIRSAVGVTADHLFQSMALRFLNRLGPADFFATEQRLFHKLPELRANVIKCTHRVADHAPLTYKARSFYIEEMANFFDRDDHNRYKQHKEERIMPALRTQAVGAKQAGEDLFNVSGIWNNKTIF